VRVFLGRDSTTGKRRYHNKTVHGTKKDAQRYRNKVLREKDLGTFVEPSRLLLDEYLDRWLKTSAQGRVSDRTFVDYTGQLRRYVRPVLGRYRLSELSPLVIQDVYSAMLARGLSARTIRFTHAILSQALEQGVKWQMLPANPARHVDLPKQRKKEMRALSKDEVTRFLDAAAGDRWYALWELLITSGLRPGEALGLKWDDLHENRIRIQRTLTRRSDGGWAFKEPKTPKSRRSIPLPPSTLMALRGHRARQAEERLAASDSYRDGGLIFSTSTGAPCDLPNLTKNHFKPLLATAGIPSIRFYDLRHTAATLLLSAGVNPKIVSERLGHSTITLTLDTYSHVLPDMQEETAEKIEALLFG